MSLNSQYGWSLLEGLQLTILVALCAMFTALVFGLCCAVAKQSSYKGLRYIANTYTVIIRGVPELVLLLLIYYGVPTLLQDSAKYLGWDIRIDLNPFVAGSLTLGLIYGAFAAEVFRGAFQAIDKGQEQAAQALGMPPLLIFRYVLLPQAVRFALPGLSNVWMLLTKATALISVIQLEELMRKAQIASNNTREPFTFFIAATLLYLFMTWISSWVQEHLEKKANRFRQGTAQ